MRKTTVLVLVLGLMFILGPRTVLSQADQDLELVGQIGGSMNAVAIQGTYAYLGVGPRVLVLNVNDPENPTLAGQSPVLSDVVTDIAISGNYAYVTTYSKFHILDVSNPASPAEVGRLDQWGYAVAISGSYAYVARLGGLAIINISNPRSPYLLVFFPTPATYSWDKAAVDVAVDGNFAYVANGYAGLRIINISNPADPSEVGFLQESAYWARAVAVSGNYAYVADRRQGMSGPNGLRVIDISNPASPTRVSRLSTPGWAAGVVVNGNYAYLADGSGGLRIINIANPASPAAVGSLPSDGSIVDVAVAGTYAYVADAPYGLRVVNIADPTRPNEAGFYYEKPGFYASGVAVSGSYAYVAGHDYGLSVLDVSNPANPVEVGYKAPRSYPFYDVAISGHYAYVAADDDQLRIFDISYPQNPELLGAGGSYDAEKVTVSGSYAFVVADDDVVVIDVSNHASPTRLSYFPSAISWRPFYQDVAVAGRYAYAADYFDGLVVVDVNDPNNPTVVGSYQPTPEVPFRSVAISGDYAYVAADDGLHIIDVSNPSSPVEVARYAPTGEQDQDYVTSVAISGDYAYLMGGRGVVAIDVSNPTNPQEVARYDDTNISASEVIVSGEYVYVANESGGLLILRAILPPSSGETDGGENGGALRLVNSPEVIVLGRPFDLDVEVERGGVLDTEFSGSGMVRIVAGGTVRQEFPIAIASGRGQLRNIVLWSSPLGKATIEVEVTGLPVATAETTVARLAVTNDPAERTFSAWPYPVPAQGTGTTSGTGEHRFARLGLWASTLGAACTIVAAGDPRGTQPPHVDDTIAVFAPDAEPQYSQSPTGPVPVLSGSQTRADVVLLSREGATFGSDPVFLVASAGCSVPVSVTVPYDERALPQLALELTPEVGPWTAGSSHAVSVELRVPDRVGVNSLQLELTVPETAEEVDFQPGPAIRFMPYGELREGGRITRSYLLWTTASPWEGTVTLGTLRLTPVEGELRVSATVRGARDGAITLPPTSADQTITVEEAATVTVDVRRIESHYEEGGSTLVLTLTGFSLRSVTGVALRNGSETYSATEVQAASGRVTARFSPAPRLAVYDLVLSRESGPVDLTEPRQVVVPPHLPYIAIDVGRCAQPITPNRPRLQSDVVVRNEGNQDATVLLLVAAESWTSNPTIDSGYSCSPNVQPVVPNVVLGPDHLRGPSGEQGFLVRLDVPAGEARSFVVRRAVSQQAINDGLVSLGSPAVPVNVRLIGYGPASTNYATACGVSDCPLIRDVLKEGWLRYTEATAFTYALGLEGMREYLSLLGKQNPPLAEALYFTHMAQVTDELELAVALEEAPGGIEYYGDDLLLGQPLAAASVGGVTSGEDGAISMAFASLSGNAVAQSVVDQVSSFVQNAAAGLTAYMQQNRDLFSPQLYLDTLKYTAQGFTDFTNAKYLTAALDATVETFTFGLVNPNLEAWYADAAMVEYARGVGSLTGQTYQFIAQTGLTNVALRAGGTAIAAVGSKFIAGNPTQAFKLGNMHFAAGYRKDLGFWATATNFDNLYLRVSYGGSQALNKAPILDAYAGKFINISGKELFVQEITGELVWDKVKETLKDCWQQGLSLPDCLDTRINPQLPQQDREALQWMLNQAGVTGSQDYAGQWENWQQIEAMMDEAVRELQRRSIAEETAARSVQVLNSYDPNDITVQPDGPGGWITPPNRFRATIRFENEGTGPAFDIRVDVPLPENLDESSVRVEGGSHLEYLVDPDEVDFLPENLWQAGNEYTETMKVSFDPDRRILSFSFPNIFLPPASCEENGNPECNEGFVVFSIAPRAPLEHGEEVSLYADIYSDLNDPVRTNIEERRIDTRGPVVSFSAQVQPNGAVAVQWTGNDDGSGLEDVFVSLRRTPNDFRPLETRRLSATEQQVTIPLPEPGEYRIEVRGVDRLGLSGAPASQTLTYSPAAGGGGGGTGGGDTGGGGGGSETPTPPSNTVTVESPTGSGSVTFTATSPSGMPTLAVTPVSPANTPEPPAGYSLPHGLYAFTVSGLAPGSSVTITITLPQPAPVGTVWLKQVNGSWLVLPVGSDDGDNVITITLTDGGQGDADGVANGVVSDPGGPAVISTYRYRLQPRWTLLSWWGVEGISPADALRGTGLNAGGNNVAQSVSALYWWNAARQEWKRYFPGQESIPGLNDLTELRRGQAYWVSVAGSTAVTWDVVGSLPALGTTQTYQLQPVWTAVPWLGVDGLSVEDALRGTGPNEAGNDVSGAVTAVYWWDSAQQQWRSYFPGAPSWANTLQHLTRGEVYWVAVRPGQPVEWTVAGGP